MALPPFDRVLFDPVALAQLGALPQPVTDCLKVAFDNIRHRRLSLDSPGSRNAPFVAHACQHKIFASVNTAANVVVILDLLLEPDLGDDLL